MISILYIEDDPNIRENVSTILLEEGYNAVSASNGKDGLQKISETNFDLVLCDIMLPDIDGFKILQKYPFFNKGVPPPFIFLTALDDIRNLRHGMMLGADDYLTKPFSRIELLKAIEIRLEKHSNLVAKINNGMEKISVDNSSEKKTKKGSENSETFKYDDTFFLSTAKKSEFIHIRDILYIKSERDYTSVSLTGGRKILLKKTLKNWLEVLPEKYFIQIHRSVILNINFVAEVTKWFNYTNKITLKGSEDVLYISQRYSRNLRSDAW